MTKTTITTFTFYRSDQRTDDFVICVPGDNLIDIARAIIQRIGMEGKPTIEKKIGGPIQRMTIELVVEDHDQLEE